MFSYSFEIYRRRDHDTSTSTVMQLCPARIHYHLTFFVSKPLLTPDLAFETCSGTAVFFGNQCPCSQFIQALPWREPQPPSLPREDKRRTCTACTPPHTPSLGYSGTPVLPTCPSLPLHQRLISVQTPSPTFHGINYQTDLILSGY